MTRAATELLMLLLATSSVVFLFFFAIPRIGQLFALYQVHTLRDRLYVAGLKVPGLSDTRFYRDIEFFVTCAIHVIRDQRYTASALFLEALMAPRDESSAAGEPHYRAELDGIETSDDTIRDLVAILEKAPTYFVIRLVSGHPVMLIVSTICWLWVAVTGAKPRYVLPEPAPGRAVARAVRTAEMDVVSPSPAQLTPVNAMRAFSRTTRSASGNSSDCFAAT